MLRYLVLLIIILISQNLISQETIFLDKENREIEEIVTNFNNYRYGNVYIYKVEKTDLETLFRFLNKPKKEKDVNTISFDDLKKLDKSVQNEINNLRKLRKGSEQYTEGITEFLEKYGDVVNESDLMFFINYKVSDVLNYQFYVVTTKPNLKSDEMPDIIALLASTSSEEGINEVLAEVNKKNIYTIQEMVETKIDESLNLGKKNLYELVRAKYMQGSFTNVSLEAKEIGSMNIQFIAKEHGITMPLVKYNSKYEISERVLQQYKKISEGNPSQIGSLTNELTISPDMIRWQTYSPSYKSTYNEETYKKENLLDTLNNPILDNNESSNDKLPDFGMELKYGVEGLYYNSFWSERLSLNAIWKSMKLGVILPTNGWSSLSSDLYNQERKFTNSSSIGIGGKIDFPFYLIKMSDVWEFNYGYVFGDAKQSSLYNRPDLNAFKDDIIGFQNRQKDYLLRGNAQLHYSFAMNIDEDYLLRFGLGGSFYSVESWVNTVQIDSTNRTPKETLGYAKSETESIGGVSGRMDFMSKGNATPYGFSMMYFDETLGLNAWLQIPVIENIFALRLEANGYAVAFKSKERDWENSSIFTPMLRVVYNF